MINILYFFLASYLMMASSYTFESFIDKDKFKEYWYFIPFVFFWCLVICWIYFPFDLGQKLFKKLS